MKLMIVYFMMFLATGSLNAQDDAESNSGRTAPNFKLENIDSEIVELNEFIGTRPILLCFWSSCCKSAVDQVEAFSPLFNKYRDSGFIMLAIATDTEKTIAKVKPFTKIKGYKFPVLYDADRSVSRLYYAYDVPFSVLINKYGKIVYSHLGYIKGDEIELENKIKVLLKND